MWIAVAIFLGHWIHKASLSERRQWWWSTVCIYTDWLFRCFLRQFKHTEAYRAVVEIIRWCKSLAFYVSASKVNYRACTCVVCVIIDRVDFLCSDSYSGIGVPNPCYRAAVARKRSRSFCQKCRWQVTAKHAYTLRMWFCMKWHGAWLYGVHRSDLRRDRAAVSCGTSHASAVSTPLWWIFKKRAVKLVTHVEPHASAVSLLKRAENSAI